MIHRGRGDERLHVRTMWLAGAVAAATISMIAAGLQQRRVLRAAGLLVPVRSMLAITYAVLLARRVPALLIVASGLLDRLTRRSTGSAFSRFAQFRLEPRAGVAAIVYRATSCWLAVVIGWITVVRMRRPTAVASA